MVKKAQWWLDSTADQCRQNPVHVYGSVLNKSGACHLDHLLASLVPSLHGRFLYVEKSNNIKFAVRVL